VLMRLVLIFSLLGTAAALHSARSGWAPQHHTRHPLRCAAVPARMALAAPVPGHMAFPPEGARASVQQLAGIPRPAGSAPPPAPLVGDWQSDAVEQRKHYDAARLSATGEWSFVSEGSARRFWRGSSGGEEAWTVLEAGAVARGADAKQRELDGLMEERFAQGAGRGDAQLRTVLLQRRECPEPGVASCCASSLDAAGGCAFTCELRLAQDVGAVEEGFVQGVKISFDPIAGSALEFTRFDSYTLMATPEGRALATPCNPAVGQDFKALVKAARPDRSEEAPYATFLLLGNAPGDLVQRARWQGRATVRGFEGSVGSEEFEWEAGVSFSSMCAAEVRKGFYADLRFQDGTYLRLPYSLAGLDDFVFEFGATRRDKGLHRIVVLGSRSRGGLHTCSYECFS